MIIKKLNISHYKSIKKLVTKSGFKIPDYSYWKELWGNKIKTNIGDGIIHNNQIVGYHSHFEKKLIYKNKVYKILVSSNWNVKKKFRSFSLILLNRYFNKKSDIYLTTTASNRVSKIWKSFNAHEINNKGCKMIFFSILNIRNFINILVLKKKFFYIKLLRPFFFLLLWINIKIKKKKVEIKSCSFKFTNSIDKEINLFNYKYEKQNSSPAEKRSEGEILKYLNIIKNKKNIFILKIYKENVMLGYSILIKEKIINTNYYRMFLGELRLYKQFHYNLDEIFDFFCEFSKKENCSILELRNLSKKILRKFNNKHYFLRKIDHNPYLIKFSTNFKKSEIDIIKTNFETSYLDGDCLL